MNVIIYVSAQESLIQSSPLYNLPLCARQVAHVDAPAVLLHPFPAQELKEEPVCVPLTPRRAPPRGGGGAGGGGGGGGGSSRRKQRLVLARHEEPILLFQDSSFFDSGLASDASGLLQDTQPSGSPPPTSTSTAAATARELSFKTPVKGSGGSGGSSSHLASSTPSKPPGWEPWKVTPLGKGTQQAMLDFSPIRTPTGPLHTPEQQRHQLQQDYSSFSFSFSGTSFMELPLCSSPRELLASSASCGRDPSPPPAAAGHSLEGLMLDSLNDSLSKVLVDISFSCLEDEDLDTTPTSSASCGRDPSPPPAAAGHSLEGLMLDSLNDSLSKVLVDISFSCLEDEDLDTANISLSEFIPQML